ncbi:MAG: potassium channel family protein [Thermoproteota archaeon]
MQQQGGSEGFDKIVEKFVELKNTSELMIDLAYSALLLNNRELAEEVQRLEEYVDKLHTEYEMAVLLSRFKEEEAKGILGLIRLGVVTEEIADAAAEIAEVVLRGIEPHPVVRLVIEEADETVTYVPVSEGSPLVNKTLWEARIPEETGMWVLAVKRGEKYVRPKPDLKIDAGDVLIAFGYAEGEEDLRKLASPSS